MSGLKHKDIASYLSALVFRRCKTVIVEGRTDKRALARAVHEFERTGRVPRSVVVVDSVEIVGGFEPGLGAREKVEILHAQARAAGHETYAFTDREFRNFAADTSGFCDELCGHHQPSADIVWTRGHSIENYFFEPEYVQEFLRYRFCDRLSADMIDGLAPYWSQILSQAATYSIAVRDMGLLKRMSDALGMSAWHLPNVGTIELCPSEIEAAARARGISVYEVARLVALFQQLLPAARACPDIECCRWIAHGHLGDQAIWAAVGRLLRHAGADEPTVNEIANGRCEEKSFHRADR